MRMSRHHQQTAEKENGQNFTIKPWWSLVLERLGEKNADSVCDVYWHKVLFI